MSKEINPEIEKKTFCLLREIKRYYQTFRFNEDHPDLATVHSWAVVLEPVMDWVHEGLLMYVRDVEAGNKKREPFASDIYLYADKARIKAKASSAASGPEYVTQVQTEEGKRRVEERLDRLNEKFGRDRQKELEKAGQVKKPLTPEEKEENKRRQVAFAFRQRKEEFPRREDLPFASDDEDLRAYEEDLET